MSKVYVVMKDENEIETLKTLTAAKKLADAENAEVYCNGQLVYNASGLTDDNVSTLDHPTEQTIDPYDSIEVKNEPDKSPIKYRLRKLMNVRKEPSMLTGVIKTLPAGSIVEVTELIDDWLHLTDGSYVLYCDGKFAEQV